MGYPVPENELERLHTLRGYEILDSHPEDRFDDLTKLAASICETPISLISLVDEQRQWFKSKIGLEICETRREDAFCAHAIMSEDLLIVPDAWADPRFEANPLVRGEPYIRFYAGAPLVAPNGHVLGALCVIDRVPRQLTQRQLSSLGILSRQVMAQVSLGKSLQDLKVALVAREQLESDMEKLIADLQDAKATISTLRGLVPVCAWCKRVRNDKGYWDQVEAFITDTTGALTTGALCPDCLQKHFGHHPPGENAEGSH